MAAKNYGYGGFTNGALQGKIGLDGKEIESGTPKVNGFSIEKSPSRTPGVKESPLMTWGEIEGTTFRPGGCDTLIPSTTTTMLNTLNTSKREKLAIKIPEKVSQRQERTQYNGYAGTQGQQQPSAGSSQSQSYGAGGGNDQYNSMLSGYTSPNQTSGPQQSQQSDYGQAHFRGAKHQKVLKLHTKLGKQIPSDSPTVVAPTATGNVSANNSNAATALKHVAKNTSIPSANNNASVVSGTNVSKANPPKINFIGPKADFDRYGGAQPNNSGASIATNNGNSSSTSDFTTPVPGLVTTPATLKNRATKVKDRG